MNLAEHRVHFVFGIDKLAKLRRKRVLLHFIYDLHISTAVADSHAPLSTTSLSGRPATCRMSNLIFIYI